MARLLLFSDVHNNQGACQDLVDRAPEVDVVVGAGDFCVARQGLDATIDVLSAIDAPTVLVPGNSESAAELNAACENWPSARVLHGQSTEVNGLLFFGLGGGIPVTPFGPWSYDFTEEDAEELLAGCPGDAIFVSHSPPWQVVDRSSRGEHLGSTAVRHAIEQNAFPLVVCGHIHGSWGEQDELNSTPVINAGPRGVIWDLSNDRAEST